MEKCADVLGYISFLLSDACRLIETSRNGQVVNSKLESRDERGWQRDWVVIPIRFPSFRKSETQVYQNTYFHGRDDGQLVVTDEGG
jgi:hypothetical protein